MLAAFVGFEVISKVPTTLHTPLMCGTNAIHGIVIVGAILVAGADRRHAGQGARHVAVAFGTINVVGGFLVTDRMLHMFKRRPGDGEARWITPGGSTSPIWSARSPSSSG